MFAYSETWIPGPHTRSTRGRLYHKTLYELVHKLRNLVGEGGRGGTLKDYV